MPDPLASCLETARQQYDRCREALETEHAARVQAEERLKATQEALAGMLESYDLLMRQAESLSDFSILAGTVRGMFVGEIERARRLVEETSDAS